MYWLYLVLNSKSQDVLCSQYIGAVQGMVRVYKVYSSSCMDNWIDLAQEVYVIFFTKSKVKHRDIAWYREC